MATKTQKEFKKQIKELEKDGKLPDSYYARRKRVGVTSGMSILFILFILWRFGVFSIIFSIIMSAVYGLSGSSVVPQYGTIDGSNSSDSYYRQVLEADSFINDVYLNIYNRYINGKSVSGDYFKNQRDALPGLYEDIKTNDNTYNLIYKNYSEQLDAVSGMIDFALEHEESSLEKSDKQYLDALIKKQQDAAGKLPELWARLE